MRKLILFAAINEQIKRMYHNATLHSTLKTTSDYESDLLQSSIDFSCEVTLEDLNKGITFGLESFAEKYGQVSTYGRGGRTCAPESVIGTKGAGSFGFKKSEDMFETVNIAELETILSDFTVFNDLVYSFCKEMPDDCLRGIREEYAEEIAENLGKKRVSRRVVTYE